MATFDELKQLFEMQEEKDIKRRKKEKEEEEVKRRQDNEEVKEILKSHLMTMKNDIKDIKNKQEQIEGQVVETENKLTKKYDDMADKVGNLESKIIELEEKEKAKKLIEESAKTCPAVHPMGRSQPSIQPAGQVDRPALEPRIAETNEQIYSLVKKARKTIGFSPITSRDLKDVMGEMNIDNIQVGKEEVVKDFLRGEMAMPEEAINKLQFSKIFRSAGETRLEDNKLFVEFAEEGMTATVFKYVRKMRSECNVITYIPDAFRERAAELERVAYDMRHAEPSFNTKLKWGWGDLILERRPRGSREQYKFVHITNLPPVDLTATPRERPTTPTSSPAPGRKVRKKRARSEESPNLSPIHKVSREDEQKEKTTETAPMSAPPSRMDAGFFSPINYVTPKGSSQPSNIAQPDF